MDMEQTAYNTGNPFKVIKMVNGEDVLCKILEEYKDALVVEYPMSVVKNQIVEAENHIVEHTGLQRWMNFTHDKSFLILKEKILSLGDLAPEVTLYYKHICKRISVEESKEPTAEDDVNDPGNKLEEEEIDVLEKSTDSCVEEKPENADETASVSE